MNLESIDIVKISDSSYKIFQLVKNAGKRTYLNFELDGVTSPFGLEEFVHVHYINWEIDIPTLQFISQLELEFKDLINQSNDKYTSWSFISNLKEKKGFEPLLKTRIPKSRGKFIVDCKTSIFEIDYKSKLKVVITVDSIWFMEKNKTWGLLWIVKSIY
jgi:hypothetical protein